MKVLNQNKGSVISGDADIANSFISRLMGLMFSKKRDLILVSPKEDINSSSIHMCFMGFPIDVIWANSELVVVDMMKDIPPFNILKPKTWRIYKPKKPAKYVIELGKGNIDKTEIDDKLRF